MAKVLIAGALGVVGRAVVERLVGRPGIEVVALSRRAPDFSPEATWVACDLRDPDDTTRALAAHRDTTHVVYAAVSEQPDLLRGWREAGNAAVNTAMLRHLLDALMSAPLEHLTLLQGTKAYGVHTGRPMRVPAREQDALRDHTNFYFEQEDLVAERSRSTGFRWTALRPQIVLGVAVGSAMNPVAALGAYAAISRELDRPLSYPGHSQLLTECTDSRLIATAVEWAWNEPRAHQQAFNITNGDVIVWASFFERLAAEFGLELGSPSEARMADEMPRHGELWRHMAQRDGLAVADLDQLLGLSWQYADATFASRRPLPVPPIVSALKLRQFGFHDCIDTEECIVQHLQAMQDLRYLPPLRKGSTS